MTPQQIAARLPELTGAPHDDAAITALAQIIAEAIRALNHATFTHAGLDEPATVNAVLGQLATAAHRLPQLFGQLARWLAEENTAGRLAHTADGLNDAVGDALASLDLTARWAATRLAEALDQAQQATAWLYRPGDGGEDR
jgi:hypothetical protein